MTGSRLPGQPSSTSTSTPAPRRCSRPHYHELTVLAERLSGVKNYHVSVKESGGGIVFLRKVEEGAADKSYGIEVAKLAGLPSEVVYRAREVLAEHEHAEQSAVSHLAKDEAGRKVRSSSPFSRRSRRRSWTV